MGPVPLLGKPGMRDPRHADGVSFSRCAGSLTPGVTGLADSDPQDNTRGFSFPFRGVPLSVPLAIIVDKRIEQNRGLSTPVLVRAEGMQ